MERFDFDDDDLTANRDGRLSDGQQATLRSRRWRWLVAGGVVLAASLIMGWAAASSRSRRTADFRESRDLPPFPYEWNNGVTAALITLAVCGIPLLLFWWRLDGRPAFRGPNVRSGPAKVGKQRVKAGVEVDTIQVGTGLRARTISAQVGDGDLFSDMPKATLYYNQGFGKTRVFSIEPGERGT